MAVNGRNDLNGLKFLKEALRRGEETICVEDQKYV
jgi:hypothetical protein